MHPALRTGLLRSRPPILLGASLIFSGLGAVENPPPPQPAGANPGIAAGQQPHALATRRLGLPNLGEQRFLYGEVLLEGIYQDNYTDGDAGDSDQTTPYWIRARLGAKLEFEDRLEARIGLVYDGEGGDQHRSDSLDRHASYTGGDNGLRSALALQDAYVIVKDFLWPQVDFRLGRMPASWHVREDGGGFILDSRAHCAADAPRPLVTNWDGARADIDLFDTWSVSPFFFVMDESRQTAGTQRADGTSAATHFLYGAMINWRPEMGGDDTALLMAGVAVEEHPVIPVDTDAAEVGERLMSWYGGGRVGFEVGLDFFGEFCKQTGSAFDGKEFDGFGTSLGTTLRALDDNLRFTLQYDYLSGSKDADKRKRYRGFVNTWEGVSDTLIVEDERYGELSELLTGNLEDLKGRMSLDFANKRLRLSGLMAGYQTATKVEGERYFGSEGDIELKWRYNPRMELRLFGGVFLPGPAYRAANKNWYTDDHEVGGEPILLGGCSIDLVF